MQGFVSHYSSLKRISPIHVYIFSQSFLKLLIQLDITNNGYACSNDFHGRLQFSLISLKVFLLKMVCKLQTFRDIFTNKECCMVFKSTTYWTTFFFNLLIFSEPEIKYNIMFLCLKLIRFRGIWSETHFTKKASKCTINMVAFFKLNYFYWDIKEKIFD